MSEQKELNGLVPEERMKPHRTTVRLDELPEETLYGDAPDAGMIKSVERFGVIQPIEKLSD